MEPRLKWNKIIFCILQTAVFCGASCGGLRFVRRWSAVRSAAVYGGLRFPDLPTTSVPHHSGCPSCDPTNSVKALKAVGVEGCPLFRVKKGNKSLIGNHSSIWRRGLIPTGKIATLAVNSLQKCSQYRFNTMPQYLQRLIFYLRIRPRHQKLHRLNPARNTVCI